VGDLDVVDGATRSVTFIALDEGCLLVQVCAPSRLLLCCHFCRLFFSEQLTEISHFLQIQHGSRRKIRHVWNTKCFEVFWQSSSHIVAPCVSPMPYLPLNRHLLVIHRS